MLHGVSMHVACGQCLYSYWCQCVLSIYYACRYRMVCVCVSVIKKDAHSSSTDQWEMMVDLHAHKEIIISTILDNRLCNVMLRV